MIKVGITGQSGFIGSHLSNFLILKKDEILINPFEDLFFEKEEKLKEFAAGCDVIIHLAALNRHNDPEVIYDTNIKLVKSLIQALETTGSHPHVLMSSSTQEEADNEYGRSKLEGRMLFEQWALRNNARFTGLIIPNVFGPFGNPFYNSVIATFCHQLTHDGEPKIIKDSNLRLIYINDLVEIIYREIMSAGTSEIIKKYYVHYTSENMVSEIMALIQGYRKCYYEEHSFPDFKSSFEQNLFNTFRSYIDQVTFFPVHIKKHIDQRGLFSEVVKTLTGGQFSFSTTLPGITRGNHFHTRKIERFIVIKGRARIEMRRIGTTDKLKFDLDGENPSFVDMPVWYTHNITNTGNDELITLFWINEFFRQDDPDTYYEQV